MCSDEESGSVAGDCVGRQASFSGVNEYDTWHGGGDCEEDLFSRNDLLEGLVENCPDPDENQLVGFQGLVSPFK